MPILLTSAQGGSAHAHVLTGVFKGACPTAANQFALSNSRGAVPQVAHFACVAEGQNVARPQRKKPYLPQKTSNLRQNCHPERFCAPHDARRLRRRGTLRGRTQGLRRARSVRWGRAGAAVRLHSHLMLLVLPVPGGACGAEEAMPLRPQSRGGREKECAAFTAPPPGVVPVA